VITAPSILPHTHSPFALSITVHFHCRHCPPTLTAHGHYVITAPSGSILPHTHCSLSLSTLSTHTHCTWSLCDHCTTILPHTHSPMSLSTVHTSYSTWSLCDPCTFHTTTHSLSIVIVDCSHVLQHMVIV